MLLNKVLLARLSLHDKRKVRHPSHCTPPYALKYIEALLERNGRMDVQLWDAMPGRVSNEDLCEQALAWAPQIVVLLVNGVNLRESRKFISVIKEEHNVIIVGIGSMMSRFIPGDLDIFLPGEGEKEAFALIARLRNGESSLEEEVKRYQVYRENSQAHILVDDLDALPFPKYRRSEIGEYRFIYPIKMSKRLVWGHMLSSRGCPYPCSFCSPVARESYGAKVRVRSAMNVVDEMESLIRRGVNIISFDDDLFTILRTHVEDICREIRKRKLDVKWIAHSRIDNVDFELLKKMKEAGCVLLRFGVESGSQRILERLQKTRARIDWNQKTKEIFDSARMLDIATHALLIIGNPTETEEEIRETFNLTKELKPEGIQIHFFNPYPGSKIYEELKNRLNDEDVMDMYHYNMPKISFSAVDIKRLQKIRSEFYTKIVFGRAFFIHHIRRYFLFYLNNMDVLFRLLKGMISLGRPFS